MTKQFCDICGEPGVRAEEVQGYNSYRAGDAYGPGKIRVSVNFGFSQRSDGFGGPPDLCESCRHKLLAGIAEKFAPGPKPTKSAVLTELNDSLEKIEEELFAKDARPA